MNKIIMMVGLPASGKSTMAKELAIKENAVIHASDELRKELFGDENVNDKNDVLFKELHSRIKRDLAEGKNVIYDATNINYKQRKAFLDELKYNKIQVHKMAVVVATPYEDCIKQNSLRDRKIPEHVIKRMYMNFYIPQMYEGWDEINFIWNTDGKTFYIYDLFNGENGLNNINQDNPHHTLTIGEHCSTCEMICEDLGLEEEILLSALLHDIGKRFTKSFINIKGEITEEAHFYQHHLVSAYDAMFYLHDLPITNMTSYLDILKYITWHMQPFFINTDKARYKFINLVGQDAYEKLMILHEADIKAK